MTAPGAGALARPPVAFDHDMAQLAAGSARAGEQPAVRDDPAADAGAERQRDGVGGARRAAEPVLTECCAVAVVLDAPRARRARCRSAFGARCSGGQVDGLDQRPVGLLDGSGHADADAGQIAALAELRRHRDDLSTIAVALDSVACSSTARPCRPAATRPPRIFVPPRSMPIANPTDETIAAPTADQRGSDGWTSGVSDAPGGAPGCASRSRQRRVPLAAVQLHDARRSTRSTESRRGGEDGA